MTSDGLNQNTDGISRLLSAAESFARTEVDRIAQVVIHHLQVQPPIGIFGDDIAARHQWDEYCWNLQDGAYDYDVTGYGSISMHWKWHVNEYISTKVENLPQYVKILLSAYAAKIDIDVNEYELGSIHVDVIESIILDKFSEVARRRDLALIGPHRAYEINYYISTNGFVCSSLSDVGVLSDILESEVDKLIMVNADLSDIASEMVSIYKDM
ncbi:MAG: hypothetical protein ACRC3K_12185, partial [Plesiomonas sp.]